MPGWLDLLLAAVWHWTHGPPAGTGARRCWSSEAAGREPQVPQRVCARLAGVPRLHRAGGRRAASSHRALGRTAAGAPHLRGGRRQPSCQPRARQYVSAKVIGRIAHDVDLLHSVRPRGQEGQGCWRVSVFSRYNMQPGVKLKENLLFYYIQTIMFGDC
ncbi:hypothetical protein PVAP13_8NG033003 [Panicum virgatum]|uniref:Secreted protein n=1 Tax=Panicum virgatum TaxID=38727 RepID=A0A8T0P3Z8_PANVG|nr:hypothetical protein PVAP13_8NG033003 [Panicum virgatum]